MMIYESFNFFNLTLTNHPLKTMHAKSFYSQVIGYYNDKTVMPKAKILSNGSRVY